MKKILAFALAVLMLCSVGAVSAFAQEQEDDISKAFENYVFRNVGDIPSEGQVRIYDTYSEDGSDVVYFTAGWLAPGNMGTYEVIGDWCVHSNVYQYPYELGVYVYKDGVAYSLKEAFDEGVIKNVYSASGLDFITLHTAGEDVNLTHKCMDSFAKYSDVGFGKDTYIDCKVYGEVNGIAVFRAHVTQKGYMYPDVCSEQRIGGYIFEYGYVIGPKDNPTGLYILKDGEVIPALKAYEEGEISIDDLVSVVPAYADPYDVKTKVFEKLGYPTDGSTMDEWNVPQYREIYAHYTMPSFTSAYDANYILVHASRGFGEPAAPADRIGDYAVGTYEWYDNYRHGLYVYVPATGELHTLTSAVEDTANIEGIGEAFQHLGKRGGIIGDADKDGKITVKDATYVQKILADVKVQNPYAYNDNVIDLIRDFNRDDKVNVQDATAIQKFLAGLEF